MGRCARTQRACQIALWHWVWNLRALGTAACACTRGRVPALRGGRRSSSHCCMPRNPTVCVCVRALLLRRTRLRPAGVHSSVARSVGAISLFEIHTSRNTAQLAAARRTRTHAARRRGGPLAPQRAGPGAEHELQAPSGQPYFNYKYDLLYYSFTGRGLQPY